MRNRYVMSLLTLGAVAVFLLGMAPAAEAELICKRFKPSGPKVCWDPETGSVNCLTIAQGVAAKLAKDCEGLPDDEDCHIVVQCSIFGTLNPFSLIYDEEYCGFNTNTDQFPGEYPICDDACLILGRGKCTNPGINDWYNPNGVAFNLPGPLTAFSSSATCESGGICETTVEVTAQDSSTVCPNANWGLVFTPEEFYGELGFCPGGFEYPGGTYLDCDEKERPILGDCCASDKRKKDGSCFRPYQDGELTVGQPGYIRTLCKLPGYCYDTPVENEDHPCFNLDGTVKPGVKYKCQEEPPPSE